VYIHGNFTLVTDHVGIQSHSVLLVFLLVMMLNPGVQEKAQVQIDAVVGKTRLPTMDDRPQLPLVDAIFRETLRYNPVVPLCEYFLPFIDSYS
jgi:cytochrome P450